MIKSRVLVVEDDASYQEFYENFFNTAHKDEFVWSLVETGETAIRELHNSQDLPFDMVLLDWTLPGTDGLSVLQFIRSNPSTRPMLTFMVTAHNLEEHKVIALESGADDYLTKPFGQRELLARLHSLLRRKEYVLEQHSVFELDGLRLDVQSARVTLHDKQIELYPKELDLLKAFLRRRDIVLTQNSLWDSLWGYPSESSNKVLAKHISTLRKKLGSWGGRLEACGGRGYVLHARRPLSLS